MSLFQMLINVMPSTRTTGLAPPPPPPPPDFSLSLSTSFVSGSRAGSGTVTTSSVTATPTGAVGSVNYSWSRISGSTSLSATAGTSPTTAFTASLIAPADTSGSWRCTATDSLGRTATADVTVYVVANISASINISDYNASNTDYRPADAGYKLAANGTIQIYSGSSGWEIIGNWIDPLPPTSNTAAYEVRATLVSGSAGGWALDTWLNLGTDRSWSRARAASGTTYGTIFIEIRDAASGTVLDSATIIINVTSLGVPPGGFD